MVEHGTESPGLFPNGEPFDWRFQGPHGLEMAVINFKLALPGWWFSVGECQISADASCGPTRESPHIALISQDRRFDDGFHADLPQPATMAEALLNVQAQALDAIAAQGMSAEGENSRSEVEGEARQPGPAKQDAPTPSPDTGAIQYTQESRDD